MQPNENSEDHGAELFDLLTGSFARLVGGALVAEGQGPQWLYSDAPFAVLAHDGSSDPRFIYANCTAQTCFGYPWRELIGLPSRLSAEAPERAERQRLLEAVAREGFIADYKGVRIAKSGRRFWIEQAIVWQLIDSNGRLHGQAATFSDGGMFDCDSSI
ncbi:MAG TPA: MEKHLA domain-containing protein [Afipia sp.]